MGLLGSWITQCCFCVVFWTLITTGVAAGLATVFYPMKYEKSVTVQGETFPGAEAPQEVTAASTEQDMEKALGTHLALA